MLLEAESLGRRELALEVIGDQLHDVGAGQHHLGSFLNVSLDGKPRGGPGAVKEDSLVAAGEPEIVADFLRRPTLHVSKCDHRSLHPRQRVDRIEEGGTQLTWRMTGPRPLFMRLAGPLMNMDKIVGKDFDRGLDRLAVVAARR